jgi:ubiquinone/menaquinone biosynthesis C-methylase UbiE
MSDGKIGRNFFVSGKYDAARDQYDERLLVQPIRSAFDLRQPRTVCEIGAGSGAFTEILIRALPSLERLCVVEPDPMGIELHRKRFADRSVPEISYYARYAENTGLSPHSVDCIAMAQCFHWLDIDLFRSEALRVLNPEGTVFILARFMDVSDEATREYHAITRFGKRLEGRQDNIEAYSRENIVRFFGKEVAPVEYGSQSYCKTFDGIKDLLDIRLMQDGDIYDKAFKDNLAMEAERFFARYARNGLVTLRHRIFSIHAPIE